MKGRVVAAALIAVAAVGSASSQTRDRIPPTKPTVDEQSGSAEQRPIFHFGARDDRTPRTRLRFRCSIDSTVLRQCARIYRAPVALAFGPHLLRVRALDLASNGSRIAVHPFNVVGTWDAAEDFAQAPHPENPARDAYGNTAWFYLYSGTVAHDPSDYHVLPYFSLIAGIAQVWRSTTMPFPSGTMVGWSAGQITMGPGHYNLGQNGILGWRSPLTTTILVDAKIDHNQIECGVPANGIAWSIDQGNRTLRSGTLEPGATTNVNISVTVTKDESLYLIVDGRGDTNCDGTLVDLTLRTV